MSNFKSLVDRCFNWANAMDIPNRGKAVHQRLKLREEILELNLGILNRDLEKVKDSIGDVFISTISYKLTLDNFSDSKSAYVILKLNINDNLEEFNILNNKDIEVFCDEIDRIQASIRLGRFSYEKIQYIITFLNSVAKKYGLTLEECINSSIEVVESRGYYWEDERLVRLK